MCISMASPSPSTSVRSWLLVPGVQQHDARAGDLMPVSRHSRPLCPPCHVALHQTEQRSPHIRPHLCPPPFGLATRDIVPASCLLSPRGFTRLDFLGNESAPCASLSAEKPTSSASSATRESSTSYPSSFRVFNRVHINSISSAHLTPYLSPPRHHINSIYSKHLTPYLSSSRGLNQHAFSTPYPSFPRHHSSRKQRHLSARPSATQIINSHSQPSRCSSLRSSLCHASTSSPLAPSNTLPATRRPSFSFFSNSRIPFTPTPSLCSPCPPSTSSSASTSSPLAPSSTLPSTKRPSFASSASTSSPIAPSSALPSQAPYKLEVSGLSRFEPPYGQLLDSVSFQVEPGQLFGLIGPSGSGKSTVLRALNRLWEPARGAVMLEGVDVRDMEVQQLRVRVGMVFQSPNLFEGSVEHNVRYGPRLRGIELSASEVELLLLRAGLQPSQSFLQRSVAELSGGEAQRTSIARALANSPEVLLMDEPTSSLDPSATRKVEETICRLQHSEGLTVILVSHSMPQIERMAEVAGLLTDGKLVAVGPPMDLRESENPMVASFFAGELD